jgi:CBS domain-containing protein/sporulation protein YlmC with PRC-barrel domain
MNSILAKAANGKDYRTFFFSEMLEHRIAESRREFKIGKLTDLVFRMAEPYPEAVGIYVSHGFRKPDEFIPWERVQRIEKDVIFVQPPPEGENYPPFVDQPGWLLLNEHLMGKTILDMDGRQIEVVNDVHLLESKGRMILIHVDVSFNGFLRKWGLGWLHTVKDRLVSWRYVQPLSIEDAVKGDKVNLSITRKQMQELPPEDLADALEELSGEEQQAVFSALDSEKAAETLMEAEPRAQRQIVEDLQKERAQAIMSEMSPAQLADLFSVLPLEDRNELMALLPKGQADRTAAILSEHDATADTLMSTALLQMPPQTGVADALARVRTSGLDHEAVSYIYVVDPADNVLQGVVDLRELVITPDDKATKDIVTLKDIMVSPVVSVDQNNVKDDIAQMFAKYHFRMLPVVDPKDHLLGVIHYNDIMKGLVTRAQI